jgi:cell division septation protein DedD
VPLKTDLFKSKVQTSELNPLVTKEFEHNRKAVDENAVVGTIPAEDKNEVKAGETPAVVPSEPVAENVVNNATSPGYYIITGSFMSEDNAVTQVNMLKEEGFDPEIIPAPNGFFRVCAMSCTDRETALHRRDSISEKFPGTWVSRRK